MIENIHKRIDEFSELKHGWCGPKSVKISKDVLNTARLISDYCETIGFVEQEVFPGNSGDLLLTLYFHNKTKEYVDEIEIWILENLLFQVLYIIEYEDIKFLEEYELETSNFELLKEHLLKIKQSLKENFKDKKENV